MPCFFACSRDGEQPPKFVTLNDPICLQRPGATIDSALDLEPRHPGCGHRMPLVSRILGRQASVRGPIVHLGRRGQGPPDLA